MDERDLLLEAIGHLYHLYGNLVDAGEDESPTTGEEYTDCREAREFIEKLPEALLAEALQRY